MSSNQTYSVYNQDCVQGMKKHVKDSSVDLVFTDPPYGIQGDTLDKHYNRTESSILPGYQDIPISEYAEFSHKWISEVARVLRPGGSCYIVSGYTCLHHVLNALHATGLEEINHLIAEYSFGVYTTKKWVSSHYHVLFWAKPEDRKNKRCFNTHARFESTRDSYNDRLSVQTMKRKYKRNTIKNKNQLPEAFCEKFIEYSSNKGDTVLDPFSGAFTTGRVARKLGRRFIGFEINKEAYKQFGDKLGD